METTMAIAIAAAVIGYAIGKRQERYQWNRLIRDGQLPKPNKSSIDHSQYWANQ